MYSDESGHNEREFNYPEEKALNQMTPINLFRNFKKIKSKKINMLFSGWEVRMRKNCTQDQGHSFFPIRTSHAVNNI